MSITVDPNWWKSLFDEVYLLTDARSVCNQEITRLEVDLICELLPISACHRILDLCGGHGRHSLELLSRGMRRCVLFDYSHHLIRLARATAQEKYYPLLCVQGDARWTGFSAASFDHVLLMGNSLGYQAEDQADLQILMEANRVLHPGGAIVVDVVDGAALKRSFKPQAWHEIGEDILVCRERELEKDRMKAREIVISKKNGQVRDCTYAIRCYEPEAVAALLGRAGFEKVRVRSGFSSQKAQSDYGFMNHRTIATAVKP